MIILESRDYTNTIKKVLDYCRSAYESGNFEFEKTIDNITFWCDNDTDKTLFIQTTDGGYATITLDDIITSSQDCSESVKYQLDETEMDDSTYQDESDDEELNDADSGEA